MPTQLLEESTCNKINQLEKKGVIMQLINGEETTSEMPYTKPIRELLDKYDDVFQEPKGLPPSWAEDHSINLLLGSKPMLVGPYKYPFFQKDEIEKIIKELLSFGVI